MCIAHALVENRTYGMRGSLIRACHCRCPLVVEGCRRTCGCPAPLHPNPSTAITRLSSALLPAASLTTRVDAVWRYRRPAPGVHVVLYTMPFDGAHAIPGVEAGEEDADVGVTGASATPASAIRTPSQVGLLWTPPIAPAYLPTKGRLCC